MNVRKFLMLIASIGLVFGMMSGCGSSGGSGGGSGSSGGNSSSNGGGTGLDEQKVNQAAAQMADTLGCDYSTIVTTQSEKLNMALAYKAAGAIKTAMNRENILNPAKTTQRSRDARDTQEIAGDCGGTLVMDTQEDTSGTSATYDLTFKNYCNSETTGVETTLNGTLHIVASQTSETSMKITASTGTPLNIKATNPETGEKTDATIDLKGGNVLLTMDASGNMTRMKITASSIKLTDNVNGEAATITNLIADVNMQTQATTFSATVSTTGNDIGKLSVSGTANDSTGQVSLEVIDENGKKAMLESTNTEGVFDVSLDGAPLGKMDCSMVDNPIAQ